MDRREFLKILGLGGVALTMPKPLDVVAARMADIERPPLHVGMCELGPLSDEENGNFVIQGLSLRPEYEAARYGPVRVNRAIDFYEHWYLTTRFLLPGGERRVLQHVSAKLFPSDHDNFVFLDQQRPDGIARVEDVYGPRMLSLEPMSYMMGVGERVQFWLTPGLVRPRYVLPTVTVALHGWRFNRKRPPARDFSTHYWAAFKSVQIDRAKAIEMELATPSEPEGIVE